MVISANPSKEGDGASVIGPMSFLIGPVRFVVKALVRFQTPIGHRYSLFTRFAQLSLSHLSPPTLFRLFFAFLFLVELILDLRSFLHFLEGCSFLLPCLSPFTNLALCRSPSLTEYTLRFPGRNFSALFFRVQTSFFVNTFDPLIQWSRSLLPLLALPSSLLVLLLPFLWITVI